MINNLNLLPRPTGFYHYYDDDSKVIYNASNTLDADNCKKVQFVTNDTDSNLKDVTGLTYKNAEKLSVTYIKGSSKPTISVYLAKSLLVSEQSSNPIVGLSPSEHFNSSYMRMYISICPTS